MGFSERWRHLVDRRHLGGLAGPSRAGRVAVEGEIVEHHGHTGQHLGQHGPGHLSNHTNQASPNPTDPKHTNAESDCGRNMHKSPTR